MCSEQRRQPRHAPLAARCMDTQHPRPSPWDRCVTGPCTAHSHIVICSCPRPQKANCLLLKKEVTTHRGVGLLPLPGPWAMVTCGHSGPSTRSLSHSLPHPTVYSAARGPLQSQEVCSPSILFWELGLGPGILQAWEELAKSWHFPLPPQVPCLLHPRTWRGHLPRLALGRGWEAFPRTPRTGKLKICDFCSKSVWSMIPRLEHLKGFSSLTLGQNTLSSITRAPDCEDKLPVTICLCSQDTSIIV